MKPGRPVTTDDDSDAEDEEKAQKMKDEKIQRKSKEVLKRIDHICKKMLNEKNAQRMIRFL